MLNYFNDLTYAIDWHIIIWLSYVIKRIGIKSLKFQS